MTLAPVEMHTQITSNGGGSLAAPISIIAPSIYAADPAFVIPYSVQANASVERLVSADVTVRADYLFTRGVHLLRTRNINLLPPLVLVIAQYQLPAFERQFAHTSLQMIPPFVCFYWLWRCGEGINFFDIRATVEETFAMFQQHHPRDPVAVCGYVA